MIRLGEQVTLSFKVRSTSEQDQRLVIDYAIDYVKASGGTSAKVFKLKTFDLPALACASLSRSQHIRELTTRRHYAGRHAVHLLVNGERLGSAAFEILP